MVNKRRKNESIAHFYSFNVFREALDNNILFFI